jgi:hypothetical protein
VENRDYGNDHAQQARRSEVSEPSWGDNYYESRDHYQATARGDVRSFGNGGVVHDPRYPTGFREYTSTQNHQRDDLSFKYGQRSDHEHGGYDSWRKGHSERSEGMRNGPPRLNQRHAQPTDEPRNTNSATTQRMKETSITSNASHGPVNALYASRPLPQRQKKLHEIVRHIERVRSEVATPAAEESRLVPGEKSYAEALQSAAPTVSKAAAGKKNAPE